MLHKSGVLPRSLRIFMKCTIPSDYKKLLIMEAQNMQTPRGLVKVADFPHPWPQPFWLSVCSWDLELWSHGVQCVDFLCSGPATPGWAALVEKWTTSRCMGLDHTALQEIEAVHQGYLHTSYLPSIHSSTHLSIHHLMHSGKPPACEVSDTPTPVQQLVLSWSKDTISPELYLWWC